MAEKSSSFSITHPDAAFEISLRVAATCRKFHLMVLAVTCLLIIKPFWRAVAASERALRVKKPKFSSATLHRSSRVVVVVAICDAGDGRFHLHK